MTFVPSESLTEQIAQYLGNQIVTGELKAGDRIQELRVADELNVSRGSVREALLILERRHLIQILPRRGAVVAEMTESEVRALYELWFLLLDKIARNAVDMWTENDLVQFTELVLRMGEYAQKNDLEKFFETSVLFYEKIYPFANNSFLVQVLEDLLPAAKRAAYIILSGGQGELNKLHQFFMEMIQHMLDRDVESAAARLKALGNEWQEQVLAAIRKIDSEKK
ncbi:MAG: GntR family transcriptional regulator [Chitinivorax sp.]|jgi:DNA-binding GntR family transcriptional regulator|nr:MAG: GntR family transcriptional regulator [Neisseriaceae bacterium]